jgi:hypothetical protein
VALTDGSGSVKLVGGQLEFTPKAALWVTPSSATRRRPMAARPSRPTSP